MQVHPLVLLLLCEALALALIALAVVSIVSWRRGRASRRAIAALAARVNTEHESRRQRIREAAAGRLGLAGAALDAFVNRVGQGERTFYRELIRCFMRRDAHALERFDALVSDLTAPYLELSASGAEAEQAPATAGDERAARDERTDEAERVQRLERQNTALHEELVITQQTLDRMLKEYASMFSRGGRPLSDDEMRMLSEDSLVAEDGTDGHEGDSPIMPGTSDDQSKGHESRGEDLEIDLFTDDEPTAIPPRSAATGR